MKAAPANGLALARSGSAAGDPRVLAGGTYLDRRSGLAVRVLDSEYSPEGPTGRFVIEVADGSRPGSRWIASPDELLKPPGAEGCLQGRRPAALVAAAREAVQSVKRLLGSHEVTAAGDEVARLAVEMRGVADKLAALARGALALREGGRS